MNLSTLFPSFTQRRELAGTTHRIQRVPRRDLRGPIEKVIIHYNLVSQLTSSVLPWKDNKVSTYWNLRVECKTSDGRSFFHTFTSHHDAVQDALDYAYLKGMQAALMMLNQNVQTRINEARA